MWTCAHCGEMNGDDAHSCEVCDRPRQRTAARAENTGHAGPRVPAGPHTSFGPSPTGGRRWILPAGAAVVAVVIVAAAVVVLRRQSADQDAAADVTVSAAPVSSEPNPVGTEDPTPDTDETAAATTDGQPVGVVSPDSGVTDPRADGVAAMFDTYFTGINDKDYPSVGTVLDPSGSVDPGDAGEMAGLAEGTRTTRDSDIVLHSLADAGGDQLIARVTFRSSQAAGQGPKGHGSQTCTRWSITYTVSGATTGTYRIVKGQASFQAC